MVGKTTRDTLSILLTELSAFSESQMVLVTHLKMNMTDLDPRMTVLSPHLLQVQSSWLLSVMPDSLLSCLPRVNISVLSLYWPSVLADCKARYQMFL